MAEHETIQFDGGLNGAAAADKLPPNQVASARNIDFSRERGALRVRRGSQRWIAAGQGAIRKIYRNFNDPSNYGGSPYYLAAANGLWRFKPSGSSWQSAQLSTQAGHNPAFASWKQWTLIANGTELLADDGVNTREWVGQAPSNAPTATVQAMTAIDLAQSGWTVVQGTVISNSGGVVTVKADQKRAVIEVVPASALNLSVNGSEPIGDYGIHYLDIKLSDPGVVTLISQDYSVGSADFSQGAWHAELRPGDSASTLVWGDALIEALPDATVEERDAAIKELRQNLRAVRSMFPTMSNAWSVWAVARPQFELTSRQTAPVGWSNIGRIRITVEGTDVFEVSLRNFTLNGAESYPLNDPDVGYTWWETWAEVDSNGVIVRESAPSPPSAPVKAQGVRATVSVTGSPVGTKHGYTHRVFYRRGGYLQDAHQVGMVPLATTTFTDTMSDVRALMQPRMIRDVFSRANMPSEIVAISEPFAGRVFVAHDNILRWSEPNMPDVFRKDAWTQVSHSGDPVMALVVWGNVLVVVCRDSVYELVGTDFSVDGDWRLYRTPCRYGTLYRDIAVRTPHGIPLMTADGIYMYVPGSGVEQRIGWIDQAMQGVFRPTDIFESRLIPHAPGAGVRPWAAWTTNTLYVAIEPSDTVYAFDFGAQAVSLYTYPWRTTCGFYDLEGRLLAGTEGGSVMWIEESSVDTLDNGTSQDIQASVRTRTWSWPATSRLMNIKLDAVGTGTIAAVEGNGTTIVSVAWSSSSRDRTPLTMAGAGGDAVYFTATITGQGAIYGMEWDRYEEPMDTKYLRTQYFAPRSEMHYQLAKLTIDTAGQPVTVQLMVDGQQVLSKSVTTTGDGPTTVPLTLSARGWTAYAIISAPTLFRFYGLEWDGVEEPPRVTEVTTGPIDFGGEVELKAFSSVLDCLGGTVTAELYVDGVKVGGDFTLTGTDVKGYVNAAPLVPYTGAFNHPFCRTAYVRYYSTTPFKHYKTDFEVVREPSRVKHWRSETSWWADDTEVQAVTWGLEGFGQTVTIEVWVNNTLVHSFDVTASGHVGGVEALPMTVEARAGYVIAKAAGPFKPYGFSFVTRVLPPAVKRWRTEQKVWPSPARIRTVAAHIDPLGGTVTASIFVNQQLVKTATLTGSRQTFQIGLDLDVVEGTVAEVVYTSPTVFRHWTTEWHDEPQPFEKLNWSYGFGRIGGASQMDTLIRWALRLKATAAGPVTLRWYELGDAQPFHSITIDVPAGESHHFWNYFPPGCRVMNVRVDIESPTPIRVYAVELDVERSGVKGAARATLHGIPYGGV